MTVVNLKVCLLIKDNDKVLLIKEKSGQNNDYKWNIVKGTVENEEIIKAAIREAEEEANVKVNLKDSLGVHVKFYGENKYTVYFCYIAEISEGTPKVTDSEKQTGGEDIAEVKWFTKEELKKLKDSDFVLDVSYQLIKKYLEGTKYPTEIVRSQDLSVS
ncbi:MAG: hypothetical protein US95_C0003G0017 [Candidatus Woesebacteria bacterium GW2011_GWB1_38_5]|uniref:Nudix hydrolase domain-containing protein n=4 Tax=Candidatus Woeseibacteriota TaxID=1752722 RepID=A0A0G0P4G1_9BACT|nr:MAG: hypothetical protein US67_C0020G0003 [Candidatus Woesebacteria bacterium GW2011_GWD1_38_10]KKQ55525.1 MAG: hypothetical protein US75_C0019G0007 [Candidatus Woesebacteria bacterium GW2011_GWC1_38_13]KKQ75216.1 MAG: hypothetical protein US97_C0044G0003 [Microgenomates group bacterium GW2011_GWF1_38_5]KKQ75465.1 MAG: hypothetical protein US95_C0003G0017 [Candidatus Woesebacteria bacterium GW2011_GWB1_38_5]KKQ84186.1 MAG: hypothetical protein UT06_C0008G0010 [Candidatus Woesebacteria bacter